MLLCQLAFDFALVVEEETRRQRVISHRAGDEVAQNRWRFGRIQHQIRQIAQQLIQGCVISYNPHVLIQLLLISDTVVWLSDVRCRFSVTFLNVALAEETLVEIGEKDGCHLAA